MKPNLKPIIERSEAGGLALRFLRYFTPKAEKNKALDKKSKASLDVSLELKQSPPALNTVANALEGFGSTLAALISFGIGSDAEPVMAPEPQVQPAVKPRPLPKQTPAQRPGMKPEERQRLEQRPRFQPTAQGPNLAKMFKPPMPAPQLHAKRLLELELLKKRQLEEEMLKKAQFKLTF